MTRTIPSADDPPTTVSETGYQVDSEPWWSRLTKRQRLGFHVVEIFLLLAAWQVLIGTLRVVNPLFLPSPLAILESLVSLTTSGELWGHLWASAVAYGIGYGIAAVLGISVGLLLGGSIPASVLASPVIWVLYATPWVALRPLATVWFGFGITSVIFIVVYAAFFPIVLNTMAGVGTVEKPLLNAGRVYGAKRLGLFKLVVLPYILPFVMVGLRLATVTAMLGLLVSELTGASVGLGAMIQLKTSMFQPTQAFAGLAVAVLAAVALSSAVDRLARHVAPWHYSDRP